MDIPPFKKDPQSNLFDPQIIIIIIILIKLLELLMKAAKFMKRHW
jgi:hypothetical protein